MHGLQGMVQRAVDSLLPPPPGVRQRFVASETELWTQTEVDIPGVRAEQVLGLLLEPWDLWWAHSRANASIEVVDGSLAPAIAGQRLVMDPFEPFVLRASSVDRVRTAVDQAARRAPLLRAVIQRTAHRWLSRLSDEKSELSAVKLKLTLGPAERLSPNHWRIKALLAGDLAGPFSLELVETQAMVTLRERFGDAENEGVTGHGVIARGRIHNPVAGAVLHLCAAGGRVPGLDGVGYVGLRSQLVGELHCP